MLVALLFLISANCFISTAAESLHENDEVSASKFNSATPYNEVDTAGPDRFTSNIFPIEPETGNPPANPPDSNNNNSLNCGQNEILVKCPSYCPSDFCPTGDGQNQPCPRPDPCPSSACKCKFNYKRAINGTCIPTRECPSFRCDKTNEEYNPCPLLCPNDTCSQATPTGKCPLPEIISARKVFECRPTCRCKRGYWRKKETCVPYNQCPGKLSCGPNEVVDECPTNCQSDYCPNSDTPEQPCTKPCNCPPPACKCAFNYRRAENGTCIPTRDCPPIKCTKPHEIYNSCPPACPSDDCKNATPSGKCPIPGRIGIAVECRPGCRCEKGYWRQNGTCVPFEQCG